MGPVTISQVKKLVEQKGVLRKHRVGEERILKSHETIQEKKTIAKLIYYITAALVKNKWETKSTKEVIAGHTGLPGSVGTIHNKNEAELQG